MARTGALGGGTLNPFGGWSVDFGAFNVGESNAAKTVSAQEQASLQFAVSREQHDAGLMTDADFAAIQQQYLSGLDKTTVAGATAQYTLLMAQYTNDRNALAQAVQGGHASAQDLVAFDKAALGQVVPGSLEYYQRQDRLWTSEGMVFQEDEAQVLRNLQLGRISNQQAQDWYAGQTGVFPDNPGIQKDIQSKIVQFGDRIVADRDQEFAKEWNKGNLTMAQVYAYAAKAQQDDPNSARARDLQQFAQSARLQAQESSFKYRYDLTREYAQLTKVIESAKEGMATGSTSQLKGREQVRTLWDGSKWVVQTARVGAGSKYNPPTEKQVAANKERLADIERAKERQKQIANAVGNIAGGWVTDQDYIRNLTSQQSLTQEGSPAWYALQAQIDGHVQRIEADKILASQGIRVAYPRVKTEAMADLSVPWYERPVGTGLSTKQLNQVQGWNAQITKLQESIASGTLTEEQLAIANSEIAKNQAYIQNTIRDADQPPSTTTAKTTPAKAVAAARSSPGGGGGSAARSPSSPTSIGTTATNSGTYPTAKPGTKGPLQKLESEKVSVGWQYGEPFRMIQTSGGTLPKGMSPSAFDDFHSDFVRAIKAGQATFEDKTTGAVYAIPVKPEERLAMLRFMDDRNVEMKAANLGAAYAKSNVSKSYVDEKKTALRNAERNAATNILWILNTSNAGTVVDASGKAIKLVESEAGVNKTNVIAYGNDLLDVTISHAQRHYDAADKLFAKGDLTGAAAEIAEGRKVIDRVAIGPSGGAAGSLLDRYAQQSAAAAQDVIGLGGKVPDAIQNDITRLQTFDTEIAEANKKIAKTATALFGTPDKPGSGILKMANGLVLPDPSGQVALNPGWARYVEPDGSVTIKKAKAVGTENGRPVYGEPGRINVQVKVNGAFVPMLAEYTVSPIGTMTIDGEDINVMGKMVTVGDEVWVENPWRLGQWVPLNGTKDIKYTAPAGAKIVENGTGKLKIPGVASGEQVITFTRDGQQMFLLPDEKTGTYNLWAGTDKGLELVGSSATPMGTPNQAYQNATIDFAYDRSTLSSEQKSILNTTAMTPNKAGGVFVGGTSRDMADFLLRPETKAYIAWQGDSLSDILSQAKTSEYVPSEPTYAPNASYNAPIQSQYLASILPPMPPSQAPAVNAATGFVIPKTTTPAKATTPAPTGTPQVSTATGFTIPKTTTTTTTKQPTTTPAPKGTPQVSTATGFTIPKTTTPTTTPKVNTATGFVITAPPKTAVRPGPKPS